MRNARAFGLILLLLPELVVAQQSPAPLIFTNPIRLTNVEGRADHMSADVNGQRLFAAAFNNHSLEVIDLKTGRQVQ